MSKIYFTTTEIRKIQALKVFKLHAINNRAKFFYKYYLSGLFVISTEGRNHTRGSAQHLVNLCRVTHAISPFGRNDIK
jgi:hypothetical protein